MGEQFAELVTAAKQNWRPVEMAQSWRSTPAVLNVVDHVFETPEAADGLTWTDHAIHHLTARQGQAGRVELWPYSAPLKLTRLILGTHRWIKFPATIQEFAWPT